MLILIISIRVIKTAVAVHHRVSGTSHYINHCVIATRGIILHQPSAAANIILIDHRDIMSRATLFGGFLSQDQFSISTE